MMIIKKKLTPQGEHFAQATIAIAVNSTTMLKRRLDLKQLVRLLLLLCLQRPFVMIEHLKDSVRLPLFTLRQDFTVAWT